MKKKIKIPFEILRFVVVGVIATILDFAVHSLVAHFLPEAWPSRLIIALATTAGFAVSVIVNYFLSILWVFQDVDKDINVSSHKNRFLFIFLSAIGLGIGLGLMVGFETLSINLWDIDLNKWGDDFRVNYLKSIPFWVFIFFFALKTLIVLSYNYLSRKFIIFKKTREIKMDKIRINMLSKADTVDGQGVGSAYLEQVALIKECDDIFEVSVNAHGSKFDIIHIHTLNPRYFCKMNKKSVSVCYVHVLPETLEGSIKLSKGLFKILKKYVVTFYRKADEIVVVNPIFIKPLIELGVKEEVITYIPNYVSKDQFYLMSEEERMNVRDFYKIPREKFVVLGVGQVQTRKGVLDFVETAKRHPGMYFVWAGGFSFGKITDGYKELKEVVENPPTNVLFTGILKREKMNDVFNMADVLFMPSFNELFPMAILEAINTHKPLLLRDLELYEDILFHKYEKGHDVDDFVAKLKILSEDKKAYQKASLDAKDLSEYYSKEHVKQIWREYYPRILEKYKK